MKPSRRFLRHPAISNRFVVSGRGNRRTPGFARIAWVADIKTNIGATRGFSGMVTVVVIPTITWIIRYTPAGERVRQPTD